MKQLTLRLLLSRYSYTGIKDTGYHNINTGTTLQLKNIVN